MTEEDKKRILESVDYNLKKIREALELDSEQPNIEMLQFRSCYRLVEHLYILMRFACIREEREEIGLPIIIFPSD